MYKELTRIFNFKLPVQSDDNVMKYHLDLQLKNNTINIANYELLKNTLLNYTDIREYLKEKRELIDFVNNKILNSDLYKEFNSMKYQFKTDKSTKDNIKSFLIDNKEEYLFFQFDIIEGNFNVLKQFNKENNIQINDEISSIYIESENYKDLFFNLLKDTDFNPELINLLSISKPIRQEIFGKLNPKRSDTYLHKLIKENIIDIIDTDFEIVYKSQDEVIYAVPKNLVNENLIKEYKKYTNDFIRLNILDYKLIEDMKWNNLKDEPKKFLLEEKLNDDLEVISKKLKAVPKNKYIYMYKKYILNEEVTVQDTLFENDGEIYQIYNFK